MFLKKSGKIHFPSGEIISFERRGGQFLMRAQVTGHCDDTIPGSSSADSSMRAPQVPVQPDRHECELHKARGQVPYANLCECCVTSNARDEAHRSRSIAI